MQTVTAEIICHRTACRIACGNLLCGSVLYCEFRQHCTFLAQIEPAVFQTSRHQHGFPSQIVAKRIRQRTIAQTNCPPVPVGIVHQIGVTGCLNGQVFADIGQDRIVRARLIRPQNGLAPCQNCHVAKLRAALCQQQIVHAVDLVQMRSLRIVGGALPEGVGFANGFSGGNVQLA